MNTHRLHLCIVVVLLLAACGGPPPTPLPPTPSPTPLPPTPTATVPPVAEFQASSLQVTPDEVWVRGTVTIEAEVSNVGNAEGVYAGELMVDGDVIHAFEMTLAAGESDQMSFDFSSEKMGTYAIALDDLTATLIVREPTAAEIIHNMGGALDQVDTYRFAADMVSQAVGAAAGEEFEMTSTSHVDGAIDQANGAMQTSVDMSMVLPGTEEPVMTGMHTMIAGDAVYVRTIAEGSYVGWIKQALTAEEFEGTWNTSVQSQVWLDMVEQFSEAELVGSEEADGVDCYVVAVLPDPAQFWQMMMQQSGMDALAQSQELPIRWEEMLQDVSFTWWVCKDTWLPVKGQLGMTMVMSPDLLEIEVPPEEQFEITMPMNADLSYGDYNEPITFEAPLAIGPLEMCSAIADSGEYTVQPGAVYHEGEDIWVYAEVSGFALQPQDDEYGVWVRLGHIKLAGPDGTIILDQYDDLPEIRGTVQEEDLAELHIVWFTIPLGAAGSGDPLGQYDFELAVEDKLSGEVSVSAVSFFLE